VRIQPGDHVKIRQLREGPLTVVAWSPDAGALIHDGVTIIGRVVGLVGSRVLVELELVGGRRILEAFLY
jgi:hypothetical protein